MKTKFDFFTIEGWDYVKNAALTTIHKKAIEGKEIASEWKKDLLRSEHSPIRELQIRFRIPEVMRWVADQLVRSKNEHYQGTARADRGGKPRNEQTMEDLTCLMESKNAQHILDTSAKRLCIGCVSKETRELWEDVVSEIKKTEPELAFYCVPNCVKRGGCPEIPSLTSCAHYQNFTRFVANNIEQPVTVLSTIDLRYKVYHFWRTNERK